TLGSHTLNFDGSGNFNVGVTGSNMGITLDQGTAAGFIKMVNVPADATPLATDRFVILDGTNSTQTRLLSSLVNANNGLVVDLATTPGTAIVQLGGASAAAGTAVAFASDRFVDLGTHALNFQGGGAFNVGATGAVTNM